MRLLPTLVFAASLVIAPAATVRAAPLLTAPAPAATTTVRPAFDWTLEAGTTARGFEVAASPLVNASGEFDAPVIDVPLDAATIGYRLTFAQQLYAGTWSWHVLGTSAGAPSDSEVRAVTVQKQVLAPYVAVNSTRRGTAGSLRIKANTRSIRLNVKILHGATTCLNRSATVPRTRARLHVSEPFKVYCYPAKPLESGTRTTTIVTIVAGGVKRVTTRRDRVA